MANVVLYGIDYVQYLLTYFSLVELFYYRHRVDIQSDVCLSPSVVRRREDIQSDVCLSPSVDFHHRDHISLYHFGKCTKLIGL